MDKLETIKEVISEQLGIEKDKVTTEAKFIDDLGADSLDLVELIMSFEEKFGVEISETDAEKIQTVQDIINYLEKE